MSEREEFPKVAFLSYLTPMHFTALSLKTIGRYITYRGLLLYACDISYLEGRSVDTCGGVRAEWHHAPVVLQVASALPVAERVWSVLGAGGLPYVPDLGRQRHNLDQRHGVLQILTLVATQTLYAS